VRRLYLQIYLGFLAILVLMVVSAGVLGALLRSDAGPRAVWAAGFAEILAEDLPRGGPPAKLAAILERHSKTMQLDLALWDVEGNEVAATGGPWPSPAGDTGRRRFGPPQLTLRIEDGRWLGMRVRHVEGRHLGFFLALLVVGLVVAVGAYPLARRLTKRLEQTRHGVEAFGAGDLSARVPVRGRDEVAALAESFNATAERIESLVESERRLIANASHELRSPLARLRVALHLMRPEPGAERYAAEAERNIDELDALVGDLLLGSRLEAQRGRGADPELDLGALVAELCEHEGVAQRCEAVRLRGDATALARMLRNLIENARQHGGESVEVELTRGAGRALLRVLDRGPGIEGEQAERLFEAFSRGAGAPAGGVGLGLALVRQIARYHGGEARVVPREGGGTCAEVELPLDPTDTPASAS
jgi:signal transduction histidine kinase